jgi:DNA invertase Pin-like site-specific DNA recombinase
MEKLGVPKEHVFMDKASGKDFNRPAYQSMLRRLKKGDTLFLSSLDRIGRSYSEIQNQWRILTKDIGVDIVVIDQPLLDTRIHKDLMGTFIADLIMSLLSLFAETGARRHIAPASRGYCGRQGARRPLWPSLRRVPRQLRRPGCQVGTRGLGPGGNPCAVRGFALYLLQVFGAV